MIRNKFITLTASHNHVKSLKFHELCTEYVYEKVTANY